MAHCDEYVELLSAALDGALSPEEQARLGDHLAQCPDCKALFNDLNRIHQALLELPPAEVPAGLTDRILEAVAKDNITALSKSKKTVLPWKRTLAAAAVFALILLGAGTLRGQLNATKGIVDPDSDLSLQQTSNLEKETAPIIATYGLPAVQENSTQDTEGSLDTIEDDQESSVVSGQMARDVAPVEDAPAPPASTPSGDATAGEAFIKQATAPSVAPSPEPLPTETAPLPETTTFSVNPADAFMEAGEENYDPTDALLTVSMISQTPEANGALLPTPDPGSGEEVPETPESTPFTPEPSMSMDEALERLSGFLQHEDLPQSAYELPDGTQVTPMLEYLGLSPNGAYYEFAFSNMMVDDPETGLAHTSIVNLYAVPMDGGEILIQRTDNPESLNIYLEATGH